jgi:hypothetical protein
LGKSPGRSEAAKPLMQLLSNVDAVSKITIKRSNGHHHHSWRTWPFQNLIEVLSLYKYWFPVISKCLLSHLHAATTTMPNDVDAHRSAS